MSKSSVRPWVLGDLSCLAADVRSPGVLHFINDAFVHYT
jgi:hypothetical protein